VQHSAYLLSEVVCVLSTSEALPLSKGVPLLLLTLEGALRATALALEDLLSGISAVFALLGGSGALDGDRDTREERDGWVVLYTC
jgi:hypothetical protein